MRRALAAIRSVPALGKRTLSALAALGLLTVVVVLGRPYPIEKLASAAVIDRRGEPLRTFPLPGGGRAIWVPLDRIAPAVLQATLAGEDRRFFEHPGVDARAVVRSVYLTGRHGRVVSGASTVTMQLVRLVQPHPRTGAGKLIEMVDAIRLERALSKPEILEQYLNRVYYGNGAHGIEQAARRFFGKSAAALSAGEATLLAVLPRAPSTYDPRRSLWRALDRRAHVLELMVEAGYIDEATRARIEAEPITIARMEEPFQAPHFLDWMDGGAGSESMRFAQAEQVDRERGSGDARRADRPRPAEETVIGPRAPSAGPVRSTLDLGLQRRLEQAVRAHAGERGLDAGLVVIEPATGAVLAMVGSADYGSAQVNITSTLRYPGSTLKPFIYALAFESGDHPASLAHDSLGAIPGYAPGRKMREHGLARYREALAGSYNLAAVDVLDRVGVPALLERLRRAGVGPLAGSAPEYGLDLALGDARVRLVDLAAAYGFLVNGGWMARPRSRADQPVTRVTLFSPEASYLVMDMLADPQARRASFGADLPLDLPFKVAAKTGTSSGFSDTLAIAATREAIVAAWAGAFDGSGTRGRLAMWSAAPLVRAALLAVRDLHGSPLTLPAPPPGIISHAICTITGALPGPGCPTKQEHFLLDHAPAHVCPGHAAPL